MRSLDISCLLRVNNNPHSGYYCLVMYHSFIYASTSIYLPICVNLYSSIFLYVDIVNVCVDTTCSQTMSPRTSLSQAVLALLHPMWFFFSSRSILNSISSISIGTYYKHILSNMLLTYGYDFDFVD